MKHVVYVSGVSGVGKSTVGQQVADRLGYTFIDGDDYHPEANVAKMSAGVPLGDDDRWPWLDAIVTAAIARSACGVVIACSALKQVYRDRLADVSGVRLDWIHLYGERDLIYKRMADRDGHFMSESMLDSQFDAYEVPASGLRLDVRQSIDQIVEKVMVHMQKSEVGLIGLGVMGTSLARNLARNNFRLSIYNRHVDNVEVDVALGKQQQYDELSEAAAFDDLALFVASLSTPRKIILMVNAGVAVDTVISELVPLLEPDDIIIDGGNSLYSDTQRRYDDLAAEKFRFLGSGVSGGELGALLGPSIMPGGSASAYQESAYLLEAIAAKTTDGRPCCQYIGVGGAGHFVKMVHNGIEYGEMQLICEMYGILRYEVGYSPAQIADVFTTWGQTGEQSYLLDISVAILRERLPDGRLLLDQILDKAGNKGTGSWTTIAACELGVPIPTITAALFARYQSDMKEDRVVLASQLELTDTQIGSIDIEALRSLYRLARIVNHRQGFHLIKAASDRYRWDVSLPALAQVWSAGCIIQSDLLRDLGSVMSSNSDIFHAPAIIDALQKLQVQASNAVTYIAGSNVATPCLQASINYYRTAITPVTTAQLLQAQRDYFGAHTFKWLDDPEGPSAHHQWQMI